MPSCKRSDMQQTVKEIFVVHPNNILRDVCLTSVFVTAGYVSQASCLKPPHTVQNLKFPIIKSHHSLQPTLRE